MLPPQVIRYFDTRFDYLYMLIVLGCLPLFDQHSENLKLSGPDGNTITKIDNTRRYEDSVFEKRWKPSHIPNRYQCKIVNHNSEVKWQGFIIGIITNEHSHNVDSDVDQHGCYAYINNGKLYDNGGLTCVEIDGDIPILDVGNTLTLTLDLKLKQIKGYIDDRIDG